MSRKICLIILFLMPVAGHATVFQTVSNGNWNDSQIWLGGLRPFFSFSDTVFINDSILFDENIILYSGAWIEVDTGGGLCGNQTIFMNNGSLFTNYGCLELDTLLLNGTFLNRGHGVVRFTNIRIWNGGHYANQDSSVAHGGWWNDCFLPEPEEEEDTLMVETHEVFCSAIVNPSLSTGAFTLEYSGIPNGNFSLYNVIGQNIEKTFVQEESGIKKFVEGSIAPGFYLWEMRNGDRVCGKGKIIVVD